MTTDTARIEIPRHPDESPRAYAARVAYATMGPGRSVDKVAAAHQNSGRTAARNRQYLEWSSRYEWVETARRYDEQVAYLTIQEAAAQYRADLEEHRKRYGQSGKALHGVAVAMLNALSRSAASVEYTPAALSTIARALTVAADLEAHALRLGDLLPRLGEGGDDV